MNKLLTTLLAFALAMPNVNAATDDMTLWYSEPAPNWNNALPLGNGRIAAMVYGNPVNEEFQLNEETISKGSPYNNYNPKTLSHLTELRNLIFSGRSDSAQALCDDYMLAPSNKGYGAAYQTAGSLKIDFNNHEKYTNFRRELKIDSALSVVTYSVGKVNFKEEAFTSFADQLLIIRLTASKRKQISFTASLSYPKEEIVKKAAYGQTLTLHGTTEKAATDVPGKVNFIVNAKIVNTGGKVTSQGKKIIVKGADEVIIYVAMATNFNNYRDITANPQQRIDNYIANSQKPYAEAKQKHVELFKKTV